MTAKNPKLEINFEKPQLVQQHFLKMNELVQVPMFAY